MKRTRSYAAILLLAVGALFTACHKEYFELDRLSGQAEWEPGLVAPVVYGSVNMSDIMEIFDSIDYVGEFDNNLIYIAYGDTILSAVAGEVMDVPDMDAAEFYLESDADVPVFLPVPMGDSFLFDRPPQTISFDLQGNDRLDEVFVKNGSLQVTLRNSFKHKGVLTISSQQVLDKSGSPLMKTYVIDDPTGNYSEEFTYPTDSFTLIPVNVGDENLIYISFDLTLINSGNPINPGEECVVTADFDELEFYHVYGFIDTRDLIDESGDIDIPLWEENPDLASLEFADPRIGIDFSSSFGIPFEVEFDSVIATGIGGAEVELQLYEGNTLEFLAPPMDRMGETVTTGFRFNDSTSSIQEFLAVNPVHVSYRVKGRTSTTGDDTTHFVLDDSQMDLYLEMMLPLDFKSTGFALSDTFDFELGEEGVDTSMIRNVEIKITTVNELPIELELQALFLDAGGIPVDSVFDDGTPILGASIVDQNGVTIEAREEINTVEFPASKLGRLQDAAQMQIRARMITSGEGAQFVKLLSTYKLDFQVSMQADFRIKLQ